MPDLRQLHPDFAPIAQAVVDWLQGYDSRFTVTSAYRSPVDQARLYQRWRDGDPSVYGALPPGRSQHERGFAFDLARYGIRPKDDGLLHSVGAWWRSIGGVWGGPSDPVHFEAPKAWTGRS